MRLSMIAAAAALLIAAPAAAGELGRVQSTELSSQGIYVGPGGVRVETERRRGRDWDRRRHWRDREVRRGGGDGCKTITVRERRPDGSVITRTRSRC
jgi:hypothetical protein